MASSADALTGMTLAVAASVLIRLLALLVALLLELLLALATVSVFEPVVALVAVGVLSVVVGATEAVAGIAGNGSIGSGRIQIINNTVNTAGITK